MALEADTVERHALRQQRLREAEHRVALGVLALDVVVVQVQLRVRVGGVRGPQRVGDVAAAHRVEERVRHERSVAVERLVDHVPRVALALVVGGLGGDVGLHRRLHLASWQGGHPRGELALPDQVVTAHPLAVRLGIGDDLVARAEVERAVGRLGGVPLHLVARRDHVELLRLKLGHRRLGQQVSSHVTAEVPAACRLGERLQGRSWRQRRLRGASDRQRCHGCHGRGYGPGCKHPAPRRAARGPGRIGRRAGSPHLHDPPPHRKLSEKVAITA